VFGIILACEKSTAKLIYFVESEARVANARQRRVKVVNQLIDNICTITEKI